MPVTYSLSRTVVSDDEGQRSVEMDDVALLVGEGTDPMKSARRWTARRFYIPLDLQSLDGSCCGGQHPFVFTTIRFLHLDAH